jgi:hypothetical protein
VARRGTRHHPTAGEVPYASGDRDYDFILIEAGTVDVLRPAMPNAPETLIATWGQVPWSRIPSDQEQAPRQIRTVRSPLVTCRCDHPPVLAAHCVEPAAGGSAAAGTRSSR